MKNKSKIILSFILLLGIIGLVILYRNLSQTRQPSFPVFPSNNPTEQTLGENWQEAGFYRYLDTALAYEFEIAGTVVGFDTYMNDAKMKEHILLLDVGVAEPLKISLGNDEYHHQVYDEEKAQKGLAENTELTVSQSYLATEIVSSLPNNQKVLVRYSVAKKYSRTLDYYQKYLESVREGKDIAPMIFDFAMIKMIIKQL